MPGWPMVPPDCLSSRGDNRYRISDPGPDLEAEFRAGRPTSWRWPM
jgi:hypothetical protein